MENALFHGDLVNTSRILYTPSDFAKSCLMHLQEIGELRANSPHISKRENLSSYLFVMVLSGSGKLVYNGETHSLKAGSCAFIDCKKGYSHETSKDLWNLRWIHFYGPGMATIYQKYLERGGQNVFKPADFDNFTKLWQNLYQTASKEDYIKDMYINETLTSLLTLLMAESWHPEKKQVKQQKADPMAIKEYLDDHLTEKIALDQLANRFFINKFYMTRLFKDRFGQSINTYLLNMRITKAKQELRFTDKSVEQIGLDCGMGELYYFSRTFKKVEGVSPTEYRKVW